MSSSDGSNNVVSTQDSRHSTTCSRVARNVKTSDVSNKLRQNCNNYSPCLIKDTVYGLKRETTSCDKTTDVDVASIKPQCNNPPRVMGRREMSRIRTKDTVKSVYSRCTVTESERHRRKTKECVGCVSKGYSIDDHDYADAPNLDILPFLSSSFQKKKRKNKFLHLGRK